jgi:hypothetical protein
MANAQDARLQKIEQRLEAIRAEATAPRNLYKVVFPGDFSIGFLAAFGSIIASDRCLRRAPRGREHGMVGRTHRQEAAADHRAGLPGHRRPLRGARLRGA